MKGVTWLTSGLLLALLLVSGISVGSQLASSNNFFALQDLKSISQLPSQVIGRVDQGLNSQVATLNNSATVVSTGGIIADWLAPIIGWLSDLWQKFLNNWGHFLGLIPLEPAQPTVAMREQIRQELLTELRNQGLLNQLSTSSEALGTRYGIMVAPATGSTTRDELLKASLSKMFADQVNLKFDQGDMSGTVTPVFNNGRQGGNYIFVLTPLR